MLLHSSPERSNSSGTCSVSSAGLTSQPGVFLANTADEAPDRVSSRRATVETIAALHRHHEEFRASEVVRARRMLAGGMPEEQVLKELANRLTNKFLHAPTQALRQAGSAERAQLALLLSHIYQLSVVQSASPQADIESLDRPSSNA